MINLEFTKVESEEARKILESVGPGAFPGCTINETTQLEAADVPFYDEYKFYVVRDVSVSPPRERYMFYRPGAAHVLNGTNVPPSIRSTTSRR